MTDTASAVRIVAISAPWLAAILIVTGRQIRLIGFSAALLSVLASARLLQAAPPRESLDEALMLVFSCLVLGGMLIIPRRDCTRSAIGGMLFLLGSTLLGYSAENLLVLLAAWVLTTIPFFIARWFAAHSWRPRAGLLFSSAALAA